MKKILLIIAISTIMACNKEPQSVEQKGTFEIEFLFEKDGCKVYRFVDAGHNVYFTDCRGKLESIYQQSSGKASSEVRIQNETN
jgi:hypothetical protein